MNEREKEFQFRMNLLEDRLTEMQKEINQLRRDKDFLARIIGATIKPEYTLSNRTDR